MKSIGMVVVLSAVALLRAEDYIVETAGTRTLESPVSYGVFDNRVSDGEVKFDQSGYSKTAEQANSFTAFRAIAGASTTFLGGYWDFGATAADDVTENFFTSADTAGNRTTTLDGAIVRNVGALYVGGTSGDDNAILLKNEAELQVNRLVLGMKNDPVPQGSKVSVTDGSLLHCRGWLSMNDCHSDSSTYFSGNELTVSGAGSRLVVDGETYLDRPQDTYYTGVGGNALVVTDGARASLQQLYLNYPCFHSRSNRVTVSKNAYLETSGINIGTYWSSSKGHRDCARFEVLDGGVVTNAGALLIGWKSFEEEHDGFSVIVSNGIFYTAASIDATYPLLCTKNSEIVISGPRAEFTVGEYGAATPLFSAYAPGCRIIIENGAVVTKLPINHGFSYGDGCGDEKIIVRSDARLACGNIYMSGYGGDGVGTRNEITVCDGGEVVADQFWCNAVDGVVTVEDATLRCTNGHYWNAYGGLNIGGKGADAAHHQGQNCTLNIKGHTPKIVASGNFIQIENNSKIIFHLPQDGYAVGAQPILSTTTSEYTGHTVVDEGCAIEFTGAQEMLDYHRDVLKRRKVTYTLMEGYSIEISEAVLAAAQAALPEGMRLTIDTTKGEGLSGQVQRLNLTVHPKVGFGITVR